VSGTGGGGPDQTRRELVERLYERARVLPPAARAAFLEQACEGDSELQAELGSLLAGAESAEAFFAGLGGMLPSGTPDQRIGPYRLLGVLGRGGMGVVYRAHDSRLDRDVALKFLPPSLGTQPEARERLLVEARAAAALEHPNVCSIHEIGESADGRLFIAMACYEGETLKERLGRGPLPLGEALPIVVQVARGLAAAHGRGIVHRDVKPGNLMLCADGTVRLLDFGLAKMADVTMTGPGVTLGTLAYMSPEQLGSRTIDYRTDLWSLGVVVYEMLTGERPFQGVNERALALAVLNDEPEPLARQRPEIPQPLPAIVERLLRKDPQSRHASATELVVDLLRAMPPGAMHVPVNEAERVAAVRSYRILGTPPEQRYDELLELAARLCRAPSAYIKFFDDRLVWFKSKIGLPPDLWEMPREATLCNWTLCQTDLVFVPDCAADERFRDHPTVINWPKVRFYCSMPLVNAEGHALGTFCVFGYEPYEMSFEDQEAVRILARQVVTHLELRRSSTSFDSARAELTRALHESEHERARSDALLRQVLPGEVAVELKASGRVQPRYHPLVTVLLTEFQDFEVATAHMEPARVVEDLHRYFSAFDEVVERCRLIRIRTAGDTYLAAAGITAANGHPVADACLAALELQTYMASINQERVQTGLKAWHVRVGLHTGPVMTGIVGTRRLSYDLWGDPVNIAHLLRAAGDPDSINVSDTVSRRAQHLFDFEPHGTLQTPTGVRCSMFWLNRIKAGLSEDPEGRRANPQFAAELLRT
jgi:adenylate cyclase